MYAWIALFRGINVGGRNVLPMRDLVALLEGLGCADVKTYIQSGNAVFRSTESDAAALGDSIADAVSKAFDFRPSVIALNAEAFRQAVQSNPFPDAVADPRSLHLFFLSRPAGNPDMEDLAAAKAETESFVLTENVFYLHAPDGIGRSRLVQRAERLIGVDVTARNWNTVTKILELVENL